MPKETYYIVLCGQKYECKVEGDARLINTETDAAEPPRWIGNVDFVAELIEAGDWPKVLELAALGHDVIKKDKKLYKKLKK